MTNLEIVDVKIADNLISPKHNALIRRLCSIAELVKRGGSSPFVEINCLAYGFLSA
jgi:hypothetical protein